MFGANTVMKNPTQIVNPPTIITRRLVNLTARIFAIGPAHGQKPDIS